MKSKLVGSIIVVGVGVFFVKSYVDREATRQGAEVERARFEREVRDAVAKSCERHNAMADWEQELSKGRRFRLSPVLTIELEELWRSERPILFIGSFRDISTEGADAYSVLIEQSLYNMDHMFSTELRLSLKAPKATIDAFLERHPKLFSDGGLPAGVAVIAMIDGISSAEIAGESGEQVEIKTGEGRLLDLVFTGNVEF